jgi:hypothetical protein
MPNKGYRISFARNPESLVGYLTWDRANENCLEYVKRCQRTALQRRTQRRLNELLDEQERIAEQECLAQGKAEELLLEKPLLEIPD